MKSFTDIFIRRPVLAVVVSLLILLAGLQAIRSLNVRQYPRNENAAITVTTTYVGASADLAVLDAPSHIHLAYRPGVPLARNLVKETFDETGPD